MESVAVEEEDRADGLVLGGGRGFAIHNKVGDELVDLYYSHFTRMAFVVKKDVFADPLDVGLFSAV